MWILHEDEHCLAVNKPAGLSTQAPPIAGPTLETEIRAYLSREGTVDPFVGTVHRLDRPASGVVLWAKTREAARKLARQFERRQTVKEYWAVVEGRLSVAATLWEDWLVREETGLGRVQTCRAGTPRSQHAITRVESAGPIPTSDELSWLILRPDTGRMHQLRVQSAARGFPILGDRLYGSRRPFSLGIALHARSLTVRHPASGELVTFRAPLPDAWAEAGLRMAESRADEPTG